MTPDRGPVQAALSRQHCREAVARVLAPSWGVHLPTRARLPECNVCTHQHVGPCREFDTLYGEPCACPAARADPWQDRVWAHVTGEARDAYAAQLAAVLPRFPEPASPPPRPDTLMDVLERLPADRQAAYEHLVREVRERAARGWPFHPPSWLEHL